jgi:hypothetical protein
MTKTCSRCGENRDAADFYRASANKDRLQSWCKRCIHAHRNDWRRNHPDRQRISQRRAYVKAKYGLTLERYDELIACPCAICGLTGTMHLDHDHETGQIREALCGTCNQGIGLLRDNPAILRAAAAYLERHAPKPAGAT